MNNEENLFDFFQESKNLFTEYVDVRIHIFKLELLRTTAKVSGVIIWLIIALFMLFLVIIFSGMTLAFFLSNVFHSQTIGFGVTTLIILGMIILITILRKQLFVNPIIRLLIQVQNDEAA